MAMESIFLDVPYSEKDEAKACGARWSPEHRKWYAPNNSLGLALFERWPEILMDESKWTKVPMGKPKLYVDLVPSSSWFQNLRSELTGSEWDTLRKTTYQQAGHHCEICGVQGVEHPVEAHERWKYGGATGIQKLIGISALCPDCHESTHMGYASVVGRGDQARDHLQLVNGWTRAQMVSHVAEAFEVWEMRSNMDWKLDITWLQKCGITLTGKTRGRLGFNP